jgi:hypothetical protein
VHVQVYAVDMIRHEHPHLQPSRDDAVLALRQLHWWRVAAEPVAPQKRQHVCIRRLPMRSTALGSSLELGVECQDLGEAVPVCDRHAPTIAAVRDNTLSPFPHELHHVPVPLLAPTSGPSNAMSVPAPAAKNICRRGRPLTAR